MANKRKPRKWLRWSLAATPLIIGLFLWGTNSAVLASADGKVFTSLASVPAQPVGLVLGTSPTVNGNKNLFFERRMDAAANLYKAGKVEKLLVSGDNGTPVYDEPTAMKEALISRGVPPEAIALDYAGFRTLDSVVRAKEIFGVTRCVIVTDDFHLPRALYIASNKGVQAVGLQSKPISRSHAPATFTREVLSRSLVWLDLHILNRQPKFLGPKETL